FSTEYTLSQHRLCTDARIEWHDVWVGALATALLLDLGRFGIGLYLGPGGIGSTFGAAGSVVVILAWGLLLVTSHISRCRIHTCLREVSRFPFCGRPPGTSRRLSSPKATGAETESGGQERSQIHYSR